MDESPKRPSGYYEMELYLHSNSSEELTGRELVQANRQKPAHITLSPDSNEYDSNSGDLDSLPNDINCQLDHTCLYSSGMPILEDGLSSGNASDGDPMNGVVPQDRAKTEGIVDSISEEKINDIEAEKISVESTLRDIQSTLQRTKILLEITNASSVTADSSSHDIWVRR